MSVDALVRGLWGEQPPPTAAKTLQSHVKRLRHALEPGRARGVAGQVLITRPPGYLLRVGPGTLDATRFEELTAKAGRMLADGGARAAGPMLRIEHALRLQASDPAAAGPAWAAADRQIVDEAPAIPLLVPQGIDLVSKRVGNYQHNPSLGAVLSQLWVV